MRRAAVALDVRAVRLPRRRALFVAGTFEHDTALIADLAHRPAVLGTVAAGVHAFAEAVPDPEGVFGVAQWTPGAGRTVALGPEEEPVRRPLPEHHRVRPGLPGRPGRGRRRDRRALHDLAGSTDADALWDAATDLRTTTLYGEFGIDPTTGAQTDHALTLVRWRGGRSFPSGEHGPRTGSGALAHVRVCARAQHPVRGRSDERS